MTADRDATRLVSSWLRDTTDALPDNEVFFEHWLDQLPSVEQRLGGRWLFGRRTARTDNSGRTDAAYQPTPIPSGSGPSPSVTARTQPLFSASRIVVAGLVLALFGSVLLGGILAQQTSDQPIPALAVSPSPTATYVVTDLSDVVANLREGRWSTRIATDDALWLSIGESVYRMDAVSGEVTEIPLESEARWLIPTDDAIWAVSAFGVQRIDRADLSVPDEMARHSRGQPLMWEWPGGQPIIADGSLWIAAPGSESHALVEIDLATQTIAGEYLADADWSSEDFEPWMAAIGSYIWIHSEGLLTQFDLRNREFSGVRVSIPEQEAWDCCIATDDAIWLPQASGSLRRFDVGTLEVTDTLELGPGLGAGVAAAGAIWIPVYELGDEANAIHRIDIETRQVTDVIAVDSRRAPAFLRGAIWVEGQDTLSRIDVETRQVTDVITLSTRKVLEPLASTGVIWAFTEYGGSYRIDGGTATE